MVEPTTENFKTYAELCSLDITESFSQGMTTKVPRQIDRFTPRLDHTVDDHCGKGLVSLLRFEKVVIVIRILGDEEVTQGFVDLLVDGQDIDFFGLGLFDLDGVSGFEVFDIGDFEFEQVASSDSVVDTKGKKKQVSGFFRQQGFDGLDVFCVLDRVDEDFGTWFRMIRIFHGKCPL